MTFQTSVGSFIHYSFSSLFQLMIFGSYCVLELFYLSVVTLLHIRDFNTTNDACFFLEIYYTAYTHKNFFYREIDTFLPE